MVYLDVQFCYLFNALCQQGDKMSAIVASHEWDGLQIMDQLPGRGRGIKVTGGFSASEVVCDFNGTLLGAKEGRTRYLATPENAMGYMFQFKHKGTTMWVDATEEQMEYGRLINH